MKSIVTFLTWTWIVFIFAFIGGLFVCGAEIWPYDLVVEVRNYVKGHEEAKTTLWDKVQNDLGGVPARHLVKSAREEVDTEKYREVTELPTRSRRKNPKIYISPQAPEGYRLIYGLFDLEQSYHAAVLLDPEGKVEHIWPISQEDVEWEHLPDHGVFPHGLEVARDGSIAVAFDEGKSLTKYDYCGEIKWRIAGAFHHSISFDNDGTIWTWGKPGIKGSNSHVLSKIDYETGEVIEKMSLGRIMEANPDIDIFGLIQTISRDGATWLPDRWHPNDIEPLPEEFAPHYQDFEPGDLLVSLRNPNLIFVMDQKTLKVKWWRMGVVRKQHDPDWNSEGTITIFNNNMHRGYSHIVELNPVTYDFKNIVDGEKHDFYTWMRGKHQYLESGGVLVTSSQQGWVFETDKNDDIVFEFWNRYNDGATQFAVLSEARFLPTTFFNELPTCK